MDKSVKGMCKRNIMAGLGFGVSSGWRLEDLKDNQVIDLNEDKTKGQKRCLKLGS